MRQVIDRNLDRLQDKKEWNGTTVVWDISSGDGRTTRLRMTHVGLVPGAWRFNECKRGWDFCVGKSLQKLLTEGTGLPKDRITMTLASTAKRDFRSEAQWTRRFERHPLQRRSDQWQR